MDFLKAEVIGSCELPEAGTRTERKYSVRVVCTLN